MQDVVTDEDAEDPEDEEDDHAHEQDSSTGSEVVLALCGRVKGGRKKKQKTQGSALISSQSLFTQKI